MTCLALSANILLVTFNSVTSASSTYGFKINSIKNPPSTTPIAKAITSAVFSDGFNNQLMSMPSTVSVQLQNTQPNYLSATLTQSTLAFNTSAVYTIVVKPTNSIGVQGSIIITWPMQLTIPTGSSCQMSAQSPAACTPNSLTRTITVSGIFGNSGSKIPYSGLITIVITMVNPPDNRVINSFSITSYDDVNQAFIIDQLPENYLFPQVPCNFPCKSCLTTNIN